MCVYYLFTRFNRSIAYHCGSATVLAVAMNRAFSPSCPSPNVLTTALGPRPHHSVVAQTNQLILVDKEIQ